jgi:quercetin dioxygenase-like cupin family protein
MRHFSVLFLGAAGAIIASVAWADTVPDALSVEWQGHKPCEKLYEDNYIRILRCTFQPGDVHVRHTHPGYFGYTLSGGKAEVTNANGTRQSSPQTDAYADIPPVPWHEFKNTGDTTIRYLIVEKKYQPVPTSGGGK